MDENLLEILTKTWLIPSLVSAFAAFVLGMIWYHPKVLGAVWLNARGKSYADLPKSSTPFVISFPLWFLSALFFTFMMVYFHIDTSAETLLLACLLWVAFAMPPLVMGSLYTGDPFNAVAVDAAYQLGGYYAIAMTHIIFRLMGWI